MCILFAFQISRDSVEKYSSGMCVPHIWLRARCHPQEECPQREDLTVTLTGITELVSFVVECIPGITLASRTCMSYDW